MLRHLSIRDFVIVAALDLEFDRGFTVFSGETGAGKSILIDALALALGARADAGVVRAGQHRADITAEFDAPPHVARWLDERALAVDTGMDDHDDNARRDEDEDGNNPARDGGNVIGNRNDSEHRGDRNGEASHGENGGNGETSADVNIVNENGNSAGSGTGKISEAGENRASVNTSDENGSNASSDTSKNSEAGENRTNTSTGNENGNSASSGTGKSGEAGENRTSVSTGNENGNSANINASKNGKAGENRTNASTGNESGNNASIGTSKNSEANENHANASTGNKNGNSANIGTSKSSRPPNSCNENASTGKSFRSQSIAADKNSGSQNASLPGNDSRTGSDRDKNSRTENAHHESSHASIAPVLLRRVIDNNARSRAFINGTPVTLAQLREIGQMLVDIHGQHAHQLLMRADAQRELFDAHAGLTGMAAAVHRAWRAWRDAAQAVEGAHARERELQLERERLAWQLAELDKLAPQPGEWEEINAEHLRLSHAASLIDGVQDALAALSEADDALVSRAGALASKLRSLADLDPALNDALAALEPAAIQLQEAAYSLGHYAQRLELDPARLAQVEKRLDALHSSARKFRLRPETLPAEHAARRAQLAALDAAANLDSLRAAVTRARDAYLAEARRLSAARAKAAKTLGAAVTQAMQELSMTGGCFEVALVPVGGAAASTGAAALLGVVALSGSIESAASLDVAASAGSAASLGVVALPGSVASLGVVASSGAAAPAGAAALSAPPASSVSSMPATPAATSSASVASSASSTSSTPAASHGSSASHASVVPTVIAKPAGKSVARGSGAGSASGANGMSGAKSIGRAGNAGRTRDAEGLGDTGSANGMNRTNGANGAGDAANTGSAGNTPRNHAGNPGGPHGLEQIEFRVAGHAGVPPRALAKIASGGELARISLALAVIASAASPTPTLIFDEVDSGIGGGVAEVVGRLLHQLGTTRQVLCVTHLPQVAARGDHHCQVAKSTSAHGDTLSTVTTVTPLDAPGRIEEIARMLGGLEITATTRRHAQEMLAG